MALISGKFKSEAKRSVSVHASPIVILWGCSLWAVERLITTKEIIPERPPVSDM